MKTFLVFFSFAVFGISISLCEGRSKRQMWPAPGPDFYPDFRYQKNIPRPSNGFDYADSFWMGPPRFDRRPGNQNGFVQDDFLVDFTSNSGGNSNNGGNRRTTTENLGPITSTPRTIHTAPQNCNCPMTQQFNPVCGTDGNTYRNKGLLNCYQRCGRIFPSMRPYLSNSLRAASFSSLQPAKDVSQKRLGTC